MKKCYSIFALLAVILLQISGFSAVRVYLISETEISRENLLVSDICKLEADRPEKIQGLVIPESLYSDSIVDREELFTLLSNSTEESVSIFGSGVRVTKKIIIPEQKSEIVAEKPVLVKKGELVELSYRKNGITIELKGKALNKGCADDEIDFRLSTGKVVKGKIVSVRKADLSI